MDIRLENRSERRRAATPPLLIVGLTIAGMLACGSRACFGTVIFYPLLLLAFLFAGYWNGSFVHRVAQSRIALATVSGWVATWWTVHATLVDMRGLPEASTYEFHLTHPGYYATMGFPFQQMHGHGGGGFPNYLPWGHGLGYLWLNFAILTAGCWIVVCLLPKTAPRYLMPLAMSLTLTAWPPLYYWD